MGYDRNKKAVIIGCTNIGKSSLFNRLIGKKTAITHDSEGVTVDCRQELMTIEGEVVTLVDTPGFDECARLSIQELQAQINRAIEQQIESATVVLHVLNAQCGHNGHDKLWAQRVHKLGKPCIILANKIDLGPHIADNAYRLSGDEVIPVSAVSGEGLRAVREWIGQVDFDTESELGGDEDKQGVPDTVEISIIGKPNAGKSTLINKLCRRAISQTSEHAGTTTDTVRGGFSYRGVNYDVYDTAGMRRKSRIKETVEQYSHHQSMETIRKTKGLVVHMVDGTQGISDQDLKIIETIKREGKRHILVVNKWDKLTGEQKRLYQKNIDRLLHNNRHIPILFMSAFYDKQQGELKRMIKKIGTQISLPPMSYLTRVVSNITESHQPPLVNGKPVTLRVAYPNSDRSCSITIQGKRVTALSKTYKKYILNTLTKILNIEGIELEVLYKEDNNPYSG